MLRTRESYLFGVRAQYLCLVRLRSSKFSFIPQPCYRPAVRKPASKSIGLSQEVPPLPYWLSEASFAGRHRQDVWHHDALAEPVLR